VNVVLLYFLLLRATALSFSGFASVPVIREDLVERRGVLTDEQLNSAIAISQASPGPLGLYVVVLGYFVAGIPGALSGALALASPAILAIPIARAVRRHRDSQVRGACAAIVIASCVLMATTTVRLAPEAASSLQFALLAGTGFIALISGRVPPVIVILASACLGPLLAH
jgi:chromate transporter